MRPASVNKACANAQHQHQATACSAWQQVCRPSACSGCDTTHSVSHIPTDACRVPNAVTVQPTMYTPTARGAAFPSLGCWQHFAYHHDGSRKHHKKQMASCWWPLNNLTSCKPAIIRQSQPPGIRHCPHAGCTDQNADLIPEHPFNTPTPTTPGTSVRGKHTSTAA